MGIKIFDLDDLAESRGMRTEELAAALREEATGGPSQTEAAALFEANGLGDLLRRGDR